MLRASRELLAVRSPLDAELMVSELLGTWWGEREPGYHARNTDLEEVIGEGLVAYAGQPLPDHFLQVGVAGVGARLSFSPPGAEKFADH